MAIEIERKFLVKNDGYKAIAYSSSRITQGYICSSRGRTVRVRIRNDKGYLTIKGPSDSEGIGRYEWEKEIPLQDIIVNMTVKIFALLVLIVKWVK